MDQDKHSAVKARFDEISATWGQRYKNPKTISDYELARRYELTEAALLAQFAGHSAKLVDVGCGVGNVLANLVQQQPQWHGLGVDISSEMIQQCQTAYANLQRLSFQAANLEDGVDIQDADAVIALGMIGYTQDTAKAFRVVADMLKPDGYFIFTLNMRAALPYRLTRMYWTLRGKPQAKTINRGFVNSEVQSLLAGNFEVQQTWDYAYVPYMPVVRHMIGFSKMLEKQLGRTPTRLSSTRWYMARKLN